MRNLRAALALGLVIGAAFTGGAFADSSSFTETQTPDDQLWHIDIAVDTNPARLKTALELGAEHIVHAGEQDVVAAIKALGGADAAISTAVNPIAFEQALGSLARGGTLVCVGLPAENGMTVPIFETVLGGLTVRGSIVGTHHDLEEVFDLHRRGLTKVIKAEMALDDVNEAIERVLDGSAQTPRLVFRMVPVADHSIGQYREEVHA